MTPPSTGSPESEAGGHAPHPTGRSAPAETAAAGPNEHRAILAGICLVSASSLMFEVLLTKIFGSKLEHHYTFAILSLALFGVGAAGVAVHLWPRAFPPGPDPGRLARYAFAYALVVAAIVPLFAWAPLDPLLPGWRGDVALPVFFLAFAVPFGLAGACVSYTLAASSEPPARVLFWDLLGAALGALATPHVLELAGGYGTAVIAAALGLLAAGVYQRAALGGAMPIRWLAPRGAAFAAVAVAALVYPGLARRAEGLDIVSTKYAQLRRTFLEDFHGPTLTYWNAIARVDVSHTATSKDDAFRGGLSTRYLDVPIEGRFILVDGGASTRQYVVGGEPSRAELLRSALWAAPYVARAPEEPASRALVIGVGGGIDVLIAKAYGARHVDGIELNPDIYRILLGRPEDPDASRYAPALRSDAQTTVALFNAEARHFCHALPPEPTYDVIQASTVDTLTAIQSAGNALSENFLYTRDAVADYYRLLRPGGVVSLSHWFTAPPTLALRMFATYLDVLERQGDAHPGRSVVVVANGTWVDAMLKKGAWSREEVARLEKWAADSGYYLVYHPFIDPSAPPVLPVAALHELPTGKAAEDYDELARTFAPFVSPEPRVSKPEDFAFVRLGLSDAAERHKVLATLPWVVTPVTDERPYFYWVRERAAGAAGALDAAWLWPSRTSRTLLLAGLAAGLLLVALPLVRDRRRAMAHAGDLPFFALAGFGFILAENAAFLELTLFVGGPLHSLSIVLPALLGGYAMGSLSAPRLLPPGESARTRLFAAYLVGFGLFALAASKGLPALIGLPHGLRLVLAALAVLPFGALLGLGVSWHMASIERRHGLGDAPRAWMWAASSAFNVIGSLLFVPVCQALGVTGTFALAASAYLAAVAVARRGEAADEG